MVCHGRLGATGASPELLDLFQRRLAMAWMVVRAARRVARNASTSDSARGAQRHEPDRSIVPAQSGERPFERPHLAVRQGSGSSRRTVRPVQLCARRGDRLRGECFGCRQHCGACVRSIDTFPWLAVVQSPRLAGRERIAEIPVASALACLTGACRDRAKSTRSRSIHRVA